MRVLAIFAAWAILSFILGIVVGRFIRAGDAIQDAADRGETLGVGADYMGDMR